MKKRKKKNGNHHRILHIRISLGSKLQLQQTVFNFGTNFPQKRILPMKNKKMKMNITIELCIFNQSRYQISA